MTDAAFPTRNRDGSFCVEVSLRVVGDDDEALGARIQQWFLREWLPRHQTWEREWKTGARLTATSRQSLHYSEAFEGPPEIVSCTGGRLSLRLIGKNSARFWRDWLVSRVLPDLRMQFPQVGQRLEIRDCRAEVKVAEAARPFSPG